MTDAAPESRKDAHGASGAGLLLAGPLLAILGALLLLPLPELGLPMLLGGLRLLGRRFAWARAANAHVDHVASNVRRHHRRLPVAAEVLVLPGRQPSEPSPWSCRCSTPRGRSETGRTRTCWRSLGVV